MTKRTVVVNRPKCPCCDAVYFECKCGYIKTGVCPNTQPKTFDGQKPTKPRTIIINDKEVCPEAEVKEAMLLINQQREPDKLGKRKPAQTSASAKAVHS
jgi:hypothetical protein